MKKILCVLFALTAIFCFVGCENDKCDSCGRKTDKCAVYENLDNKELCPECAFKEGVYEKVDDIIDILG